jgi:hypothetical protein
MREVTGDSLKLRRLGVGKSPDQRSDFRRAPGADFLNDRLLLADGALGFAISLNIFFCWRRTSADQ